MTASWFVGELSSYHEDRINTLWKATYGAPVNLQHDINIIYIQHPAIPESDQCEDYRKNNGTVQHEYKKESMVTV